jgi:hypothetical protein
MNGAPCAPSPTRLASGETRPLPNSEKQQKEVQDRHDPGGVEGRSPRLALLFHSHRLQHFRGVARASGGRDFVAAVGAGLGEAEVGEAVEAGAVFEAWGSAVIGDQGQAVQGRSAAGFQVGLVPHPSQGGAGLVALQVMARVAG